MTHEIFKTSLIIHKYALRNKAIHSNSIIIFHDCYFTQTKYLQCKNILDRIAIVKQNNGCLHRASFPCEDSRYHFQEKLTLLCGY